MTVSKNGVRKTERVIEGVGEDVSLHPKRGNFVLLDEGAALYGGHYYYLHGYAPQSAVKPEPGAEPEPAHRNPEGLYQSAGTRVIVRHEPEDETYSLLYIDNALNGHPTPVNRGMTQIEKLGYKLVTEFKA